MFNPFKFTYDLINPPTSRKLRQQILDSVSSNLSEPDGDLFSVSKYNQLCILAKCFRHTDTARIPTYARDLDAGADLYADANVIIEPGKFCLVSTGLSIIVPGGLEIQIRPRSGMAFKHGITVLNSPGTIDAGYKGLISVLLHNVGEVAYQVNIGDRIAQAVFAPVARAEFDLLSSAEFEAIDTDRGIGGFGSTGKNQRDIKEGN